MNTLSTKIKLFSILIIFLCFFGITKSSSAYGIKLEEMKSLTSETTLVIKGVITPTLPSNTFYAKYNLVGEESYNQNIMLNGKYVDGVGFSPTKPNEFTFSIDLGARITSIGPYEIKILSMDGDTVVVLSNTITAKLYQDDSVIITNATTTSNTLVVNGLITDPKKVGGINLIVSNLKTGQYSNNEYETISTINITDKDGNFNTKTTHNKQGDKESFQRILEGFTKEYAGKTLYVSANKLDGTPYTNRTPFTLPNEYKPDNYGKIDCTLTQNASKDECKDVYVLLAPLGKVGEGLTQIDANVTFADYFKYLIRFVMGFGGVLAVVMIVIGGIQWMGTDSIFDKNEGKEKIKNALFGLVLMLSAYVLLNTINPQLVDIHIGFQKVGKVTTSGAGGYNPSLIKGTPNDTGVRLNQVCEPKEGVSPIGGCMEKDTKCTQYFPAIKKASKDDPTLEKFLKSIMRNESTCDINASSRAGAYGLFQMLESTANQDELKSKCSITEKVDEAWLKNPVNIEKNACLAVAFIKVLKDGSCGSDWHNLAAGYNGGEKGCFKSADCTSSADKSCLPANADGTKMWECPYENPAHTLYNLGYNESRNYAKKVIYCMVKF